MKTFTGGEPQSLDKAVSLRHRRAGRPQKRARSALFMGLAACSVIAAAGAAHERAEPTAADLAATLAHTESITARAERDQFSPAGSVKKLTAEVAKARALWSQLTELESRALAEGVALHQNLRLRIGLGRIVFYKRFGPVGPAQACDRLIALGRQVDRGNDFRLDAQIAWFASQAWGSLAARYTTRHLLPGGKWSKPQSVVDRSKRRSDQRKKYHQIALRYALRAARLEPTDPNVGWLFWTIPMPHKYGRLALWGACLFLTHHPKSRWWCFSYDPGNIRAVLQNIKYNLKILAPKRLHSVELGTWQPTPLPEIPSWHAAEEDLWTVPATSRPSR